MSRLPLLALLLLPAAAVAQPPAAPDRSAGGADWQAAAAARRAEVQADIATVLALRPDQQPALQTWLAASAPGPGGPGAGDPDARAAAASRFRAALDPRQQQVFDALERLRHRTPRNGWRGRGGGDDGAPPPGE